MNYTECIENARPRLGKYCKACPECNGRACKNQMPGPGSKGIGDTAIRNYDKWKQSKRQTMRQSLKSTPPIIGDVASCIRPEDYLTMA